MNMLTMPKRSREAASRRIVHGIAFKWTALLVASAVLVACGKTEAPASKFDTSPAPAPAPAPAAASSLDSSTAPVAARHFKHANPPPKIEELPPPGAGSPQQKFEGYSVAVRANAELEIPGKPGVLKVWIGETDNTPKPEKGERQNVVELRTKGQTARVEPHAAGMKIEPAESLCEKIDPTGSEVEFQITPIESGEFEVGATVKLYDSSDCSGAPVPKSANSVAVTVRVNKAGIAKEGMVDLGEVAWKDFLSFWDKLLVLGFALLLFLIRKRLSKWFGFKPKE